MSNVLALRLSSNMDVKDLSGKIEYFQYMEDEFVKFTNLLSFPITIILEKTYVDRTFRDCYYYFYASKHFQVEKNCQRITLFEGEYTLSDFYNEEKTTKLKNDIIGTIVIRPLIYGAWGRTLIDPKKLNQKEFYVRTTKYQQIINGIEFTINAYPFSSQDVEVMSCAETSVWTILNYYGTRYSEYRTVLPSEIISEISLISKERVLPTQGLTYLQKSNILKKFGFSPRVYSRDVYGDIETKRVFHYYVESGIPLTISLNNHSTVCIGHVKTNSLVSSVDSGLKRTIGGYTFVDSADMHDEYVIIDDNQFPYKLEKYDQFSIYQTSKKLKLFAVPLNKRIFLEANAAKRIFDKIIELLFDKIDYIRKYWMVISKSKSNAVVERIFLTSSRKYKAFRIRTANNAKESAFYLDMSFPKFIWVMELTTDLHYDDSDSVVLGEIVLDATASKYSNFESIIAIRIGKVLSYRKPDEGSSIVFDRIQLVDEINDHITQYENNLMKGGKNVKD